MTPEVDLTADLVDDAAGRAAAWQHPLLLELDSRAYADSGALGSFPRYYPEYWRMEEHLRAGVSGTGLGGMMNFGDTGIVRTEGGKQVTYTTDNVSYDHTRSVVRQYMRTAYQTLFWKAEAMAFHLMDVDTIHYSREHPEQVLFEQVVNLRQRVSLIRNMQAFGMASLFTTVLCMFILFIGNALVGHIFFGLSLFLMLISLGLSLREILISVRALDLELSSLEGRLK